MDFPVSMLGASVDHVGIVEFGYVAILCALPVLLIYLSAKLQGRGFKVLRFGLVVFISLAAVHLYDASVNVPLPERVQAARASGDAEYDGTGAGAALLVAGIIVPSVLSLAALGFESRFTRRFKKRNL